MSKIILISCVSKKLSKKAKAKDLYISPLFKMNLAYAKILNADTIFVLSAKYGLVGLNQEIDTYNQTLNTMPVSMIKKWAEKVKIQMKGKIHFEKDEIIFLAGERYRRFLAPLFKSSHVPMKGLGIGKQLQFLKNKINAR